MLAHIKQFLADLTGGKPQERFDEDDYRLAAAALIVHVATLDGALDAPERQRLHAVLKARFGLDDEATDELIAAAAAADRNAVDFYQFTSLIMRALDEAGRLKVVEMMWEMALVDGQVSEFEDNVLWRVADLLGLSNRQRIALRRKVSGADKA